MEFKIKKQSIMKTSLLLLVLFATLISCEKTEYIDSEIEGGKCKMNYILNIEPGDEIERVFLHDYYNNNQITIYKSINELPDYLLRNSIYVINVTVVTSTGSTSKYIAAFDIENETKKTVEIKKYR